MSGKPIWSQKAFDSHLLTKLLFFTQKDKGLLKWFQLIKRNHRNNQTVAVKKIGQLPRGRLSKTMRKGEDNGKTMERRRWINLDDRKTTEKTSRQRVSRRKKDRCRSSGGPALQTVTHSRNTHFSTLRIELTVLLAVRLTVRLAVRLAVSPELWKTRNRN